jgi:transcriptional regulator
VYIPAAFALDEAGTAEMLAQTVAGDLISVTEQGLTATFLPLVWDPDRGPRGAMLGHLARLNDHWRTPSIGQALIIAHGPDAYVSPSWYPSKAEHGRVVPTWNYTQLHIHGELVVHDDPDWTLDIVTRLTDRHEGDRPHPWRVDDAPKRFLQGQLRAIVGVEVLIDRIEAKAKMSQNRPGADIDGVVTGLRSEGRAEVAELVARARPDRG